MNKVLVFSIILILSTSCGHFSSRDISDNFVSKRLAKTSTITLKAPLEKVFPLFGPIKEKEWADGWNPKIIYSTTNIVDEHMVFRIKSHAHGESSYMWMVTKYLPHQSLIEYTVFTEERVWNITVQCHENTNTQMTDAEITYTFTGLTETGNAINEKALEHMYSKDLKDWEEAINYYLKTGKVLRQH